MKPLLRDIKRRYYARFTHKLDTPKDRKSSLFFREWIDVGFLRHRWTNEGAVAPDVIRTNNPNEKRWAEYAERGIKTALNLRNDTDRAPFKLAQEACEAHGINLVSFPMLPRIAPPRETLLELIDLLPTLEKPVLLHCKSGADRTGLVGAIWRLTQEDEPLAIAREELSLRYIHRRDSETGVLDEVLDAFEPFEGQLSFRDWVETEYDPEKAQLRFEQNRPQRNLWGRLKYFYKDVYTYAQYREAVWHDSFTRPIKSEADEKRARFFVKWIDHGVLRTFWHNFHKVGDEIYRSNHPSEARFRKYAADGFKTVVNLRGASAQPQYLIEQKLCSELGLTLIDIPMSGTQAPSRDIVLSLLDTFETAEGPMFLHCKSGADRTGFASALYQLSSGVPYETARRQLSLRYLHLKRGSKGVLGWVLQQYAQNPHTQNLRDWVQNHYDPDAMTNGFRALRGKGSFPARVDGGKVAVITSVGPDLSGLDAWLDYYGTHLGNAALYVIVHGFAAALPPQDGVTFIQTPQSYTTDGAKQAAARTSNLAEALLRTHDSVVGVEVDEFLALDPARGMTLADYLSGLTGYAPVAVSVMQAAKATGDVSAMLQSNLPSQTKGMERKPVILRSAASWGPGQRTVRGQTAVQDNNLILVKRATE